MPFLFVVLSRKKLIKTVDKILLVLTTDLKSFVFKIILPYNRNYAFSWMLTFIIYLFFLKYKESDFSCLSESEFVRLYDLSKCCE